MTIGKHLSDEKKSGSPRETVSANDVSSFCKTFERAVFLSIQKRAGYKVEPQQLHDDTQFVIKAR